jgi:hypothetical protein
VASVRRHSRSSRTDSSVKRPRLCIPSRGTCGA